jgi:putative MFS transporter
MAASPSPEPPTLAPAHHAPSPSTEFIAARLDALPIGRWHRRMIRVVGVGSFFNFYEVALGTLLVPLLPTAWTHTTLDKSMLIGAAFAGEMVGALLLSRAADRFGRRRMFQVNLIAYALLSVLAAAAWSLPTLIAARTLIGVGLGAELTLVDTYLAELMPAARRGRLMVRSYLFGTIAIPIAGVLAARLPHNLVGLPSWRWMTIAGGLGALIIWLLRRRLPESPRWLAAQGRTTLALDQLAAIEAQSGVPIRQSHVASTPATPAADAVHAAVETERPRLLAAPLRRRTILVCVMQAIGPVGFYGFASVGTLVLLHRGFSVVDSLGYSALTACGYPLGTLLLGSITERFERRTLIIVSSLLVAICGLLFGTASSAGMIVVAGAGSTICSVIQSTVARAYAAELFPTAVRNTALGRTYALSRLVSALLPFAALSILEALGAAVLYLVCAALLTVLAAVVAALGPRTNARQLEAI